MSTLQRTLGVSRNATAAAVAVTATATSVGLGVAASFVSTALLSDSVALALLLTGLLASRVLYGTIASPLGLFAIAWEGSLLLASLHLVGYLPISFGAYLVLHGSYVAVIAGSIAAGPSDSAAKTVSAPWLGRICLGLGVVGVLWGLWELNSTLGLTAIFSQASAVRIASVDGAFGVGGSSYLRLLLIPAAVLLRPVSKETAALLATSVVWSILTAERSSVLTVGFVVTLGVLFRSGSQLRLRQWALGGVIAAVGLVVFLEGATLLGKDTLVSTYVDQAGGSTVLPRMLLGPYVYTTGPFIGFGRYFDEEPAGSLGLPALVTPLVRLQGQKENVLYEFRGIPFPFNLYTYLRSWYDGLGVAGTIVGPALIGFMTGAAYRRRGRSIAWLYFSCVMTYGLVGGVFNPILTYSGTFALLAFAWVIPRLARLTDSRRDLDTPDVSAVSPLRQQRALR